MAMICPFAGKLRARGSAVNAILFPKR